MAGEPRKRARYGKGIRQEPTKEPSHNSLYRPCHKSKITAGSILSFMRKGKVKMYYKLISNDNTIKSGQLVPVITQHGHDLDETKEYFNGAPDYENLSITFSQKDETVSFTLKTTKTGYSGSMVKRGIKYGVNLNRVRNRRNRWGLTAWIEFLKAEKGGQNDVA